MPEFCSKLDRMGKCNACWYHNLHPGDQSCRFVKDAKERAKEAGNEEDWKLYLDTDVLDGLQAAEETKSQASKGTEGGLDIKPVLPSSPEEQMLDLRKRMDSLTLQMQDFLKAQSRLPLPVPPAPVVSHSPPLRVAVTTSAVSTSTPAISGVGPSLYATSTPVSTVASTLGHFHAGVPTMSTGVSITPSVMGFTPGPSVGSTRHVTPTPPMYPAGMPSTTHHRGLAGDPTAASSWLPDPLTSALQQLSNAVDPDASIRSAGMRFRPDYHALHKLSNIPLRQVDYRKMSFKQLMYGMTCVAQNVRAGGYDIDGYLSHIEFITRHASDESYTDCAYAEYDHFVIDRFLKNPVAGFVIADSVAIGHAFHPAKLNMDVQDKGYGVNKMKRKPGKKSQRGEIPEGYPENNCFYWNYRVCNNAGCQKKHSCHVCEGNHKAVGCPRDKK